MDRKIPANEEAAARAIDAMENPITQTLLRFALARARMQFMRSPDQTAEDWESRLPVAPFDMHFLVKVLSSVFEQEDVLRRVLDGQSLEEATGWNA